MKIVAAVYSHPEYYPPTLNAINVLAQHVKDIEVICRNVKKDETVYPRNVRLKKSGIFKKIGDTQIANYFWKLKSFILFTIKFYRSISKTSPVWVIVYDPIPLLSYKLIRHFLSRKPKLWYHNHDVIDSSLLKKYSISWFAYRTEQNAFKQIDLFSLPSEERKIFFPINRLKGQYFFLPNYPSIQNYPKSFRTLKENEPIKLIYQGHIGAGHGLVEILNYLKTQKKNSLFLTIIGNYDEDYKQLLEKAIDKLGLSACVKIHEPVPYSELLQITHSHHIGLAIHEPINLAFKTASTSSNKIYEYVRCGMPVMLYDDESYKQNLSNRKWAFFTDLSYESLIKNLKEISEKHPELSKSALADFENELNFEHHFNQIILFITAKN